jgi:DNA repair exonuclease SbcCD ATPase subunit
MKLIRLGTSGFGGLSGYFRFDPERVTIVIDENERGKTTMLAAIAAALYGLTDDRRSHRLMTPLERWRPWEGTSYDVEIEVEHEGNRYTVSRDFDRSTVDIRDGSGRDVAAEFREGKDEYPVGLKLLGLDAAEFEKCALVRQGDLLQVVPADERERRESTLRSRLEAAADSRIGDSRASDALRAIDSALRRYTCPEVDFTGTAENALQRLEAREKLIETQIHELEHEYGQIEQPLEELAALTERERETRTALDEIENERRAGLAAEAKAQLEEDRRHREEVATLRREADGLRSTTGMPADAEAQLREAVAKLDAAQRRLSDFEQERAEETKGERERLEEELASLGPYRSGTAADADRCVSLAAELRRMIEDDTRLRDEVFQLREALASGGHDGDRLQWLNHRLGALGEGNQALLRRQSELALQYQTEVAGLENQRTKSSEMLRAIDGRRNAMSVPGWFLLALGLAGVLAGSFVVALQGLPGLSTAFFVAGAIMLAGGIALTMAGRQHRADEREEAIDGLGEAQRRLGQLRQQRAETESELENVARDLGYRDHIELLREWGELERLRSESSPTLRAQHQLILLESRRQQVTDEARAVLERFGDLPVTAESLETAARELRRAVDLERRRSSIDRDRPWRDDRRREEEATAAGHRERAMRILDSAGISREPARPWEDLFRELAERSRGRQRHATLVEELIPAAEKRLLSAEQVSERERRVALVDDATLAAESGRGASENETRGRQLREDFEEVQKRRADLRLQVEERAQRYHAQHAEKRAELERVREAAARARRFREAVQIAATTIQSVATETHRRWAEFLNQRVAELLDGVGTRIEQVRFGDDLDFSVRMTGTKALPRGKADSQLSCAARDQLYLAVRLAISEYVSRGGSPLPLLLDDPFATSDDVRARAGMRTLLEQMSGHQILLVTCHRQRYERLAELDPDLYADRVQVLTTKSSALPK